MRKIIKIAYYEFIKNIRDRKMIHLLVISPIILIFILGTSLKSFLTLENQPSPVVGYVNNEDTSNLNIALTDYLNSEELSDIIVIRTYENMEIANSAMESKEISCIIELKPNLEIELSGDKNTTYVETILNAFVNNYNLHLTIINKGLEIGNGYNQAIERGILTEDNVYPTSMDYYAIQTILQILTLCSVFGIGIILNDRTKGIFIRVNSLPVNQHSLIIGRIIGSVIFSFIAAIIAVLFSKYVYQANWNGNAFFIMLAFLLFVINMIGIGALLAQLTKSYTSSIGLLGLIAIVFPAASGAFSPKSTMKFIAIFTPNYYSKNMLFGTIYQLPISNIIFNICILVLMSILIYTLIIFIERKRNYENI